MIAPSKVLNYKSLLYLNSLFVSVVVLMPLAIIFLSFFGETSSYFKLLKETFFLDYIMNTTILLVGVCLVSLLLGIISAYLVSFYTFPASGFFKYGLILSFAIPPYIYAYSLSSFFENYGTAYSILNFFFRNNITNSLIPDVNGFIGCIISLSLTLFGYVFILARSSFIFQSQNLIEVGKNLGLSTKQIFFKIIIPSARPALIAGTALVSMETISDFGTVSFFGVSTFTTAIYNSWISFDDLNTANRLSFFLIFFILFFFCIEKVSRKNAKYYNTSGQSSDKRLRIYKLKGNKGVFAFIFCVVLFSISFIFPVIQMLYWTFKFPNFISEINILELNINVLFIVFASSSIIILIGFLTNYTNRIFKNTLLNFLSIFLISGYAIPGVILSISLITFFSIVFKYTNISILYLGSIYALILAYFIRFFSIAFNGIKSSYSKINKSIDESAYLIGISKFKTFILIHLPTLKQPVTLIGVLIGIEILKELPITLILRPFNFETFSTLAFSYAEQDLIEAAAFPSIFLIFWTTIFILISSKIFLSEKK